MWFHAVLNKKQSIQLEAALRPWICRAAPGTALVMQIISPRRNRFDLVTLRTVASAAVKQSWSFHHRSLGKLKSAIADSRNSAIEFPDMQFHLAMQVLG